MRTSLRASSSKLCSEALTTFVPPRGTGSNSATGVTVPVRPTYVLMFRTTVCAASGGYLNATTQRGAFEVAPSSSCSSRRLTLTTMPSISKSRSWRCSRHSSMNAIDFVERRAEAALRVQRQAEPLQQLVAGPLRVDLPAVDARRRGRCTR